MNRAAVLRSPALLLDIGVKALLIGLLVFAVARPDYPYALDILLVLPFLVDVAGNAANLYDTIDWWDDANHFVNWGILVLAFGQLLIRLPLERWVAASLAVGFSAATAALWEFAEYFTFIRNSPERQTAYTDTLGDLALGLSGSVIAGVLTVTVLWPRER